MCKEIYKLCICVARVCRVGLDIPTIEVRFEHLNVEAEAHVGSRALPTIFNFTINMLEVNKHGQYCTTGLDVIPTVLFEAEYTDKFECMHLCSLSAGVPELSSPYSQSKEAVHSSS